MKRKIAFIALAAAAASVFFTAILIPSRPAGPLARPGRGRLSEPEAYNALTFFSRARAYPGADISPDRQFKAFERASAARQGLGVQSPAVAPWQSIGPQN